MEKNTFLCNIITPSAHSELKVFGGLGTFFKKYPGKIKIKIYKEISTTKRGIVMAEIRVVTVITFVQKT